MRRVWGIFAVFLLLPLSALGQDAAKDEREQEMQEMRARIEKLEKLVAQLQKEISSGMATAPAAGDQLQAAATPISHEAHAASHSDRSWRHFRGTRDRVGGRLSVSPE